jgi:hypothetical protein
MLEELTKDDVTILHKNVTNHYIRHRKVMEFIYNEIKKPQ